MKSDFRITAKTLRTSNSGLQVVAINGCCYGKSANPDKGDYYKYCGQRFWEFISGNAELYTEIIEPLGHKAKEKTMNFSNPTPRESTCSRRPSPANTARTTEPSTGKNSWNSTRRPAETCDFRNLFQIAPLPILIPLKTRD